MGSSANIATAITVVNTIVANQLRETRKEIDDKLKTKKQFKDAVLDVLRKYYKDAKKVCFEGNNYSAEWEAEAKKRGLPNVKTTPEALQGWVKKESLEAFEKLKVLSKVEVHSRHHIKLEKYAKDVDIEAKLVIELANNQFVPAALEYQNQLLEGIRGLQEVLPKEPSLKSQIELLRQVAARVDGARRGVESLQKALAAADKVNDVEEKALAYCHKVKPHFEVVRAEVDALEGLVPDKLWPLPKYREMLFLI